MIARTSADEAYDTLLRLVNERTGLSFSQNHRPGVEVSMKRAMAKTGVSDVTTYLERLEAGGSALDELVSEITVQESYFFRDPDQFEFIRQGALPDIQRCRGAEHGIRVWSAGCASGEEAYSLAITLEEHGVRGHVLATDISRAALAKAQKGVYTAWSIRRGERDLTDRYFRCVGDRFSVLDRYRSRVSFEYFNLARDAYPSFAAGVWGMDLILCRNVLIYFDRETSRRVILQLLDTLAEGGWLVLGPSDPPACDDAPCETIVTPSGLYYRRGGYSATRQYGLWSAPPEPFSDHPIDLNEAPAEVAVKFCDDSSSVIEEVETAIAHSDYERVGTLAVQQSQDPAACVKCLRALANAGELERALDVSLHIVKRRPFATEPRFLQAVILLELGKFPEAARAARETLYLNRSLEAVHYALGVILHRQGDTDGARQAYRNVRRLCLARPPDEIVPLSDGESARRLADAAKAQLELLDMEVEQAR